MRVGLGRAGIAEWGIRQDIPREARLRHGCELEPVAAFRDRFSYSNLCYIALCLAAERLTGKTYATLVRDLVCAPLGMTQTVSIGDGVPSSAAMPQLPVAGRMTPVRDLTRSEEHTSELQSLMRISYAVFCLKKKKSNYAYDS